MSKEKIMCMFNLFFYGDDFKKGSLLFATRNNLQSLQRKGAPNNRDIVCICSARARKVPSRIASPDIEVNFSFVCSCNFTLIV